MENSQGLGMKKMNRDEAIGEVRQWIVPVIMVAREKETEKDRERGEEETHPGLL